MIHGKRMADAFGRAFPVLMSGDAVPVRVVDVSGLEDDMGYVDGVSGRSVDVITKVKVDIQ